MRAWVLCVGEEAMVTHKNDATIGNEQFNQPLDTIGNYGATADELDRHF